MFGVGISPLAVVQESIILRNNSSTSNSVGKTVAVGLLLGKASSFAAAFFAEPLASISPILPFLTAVALALFSFLACVLYASLEASLPPKIEDAEDHKPHPLSLHEVASFGDPFWLYIGVW